MLSLREVDIRRQGQVILHDLALDISEGEHIGLLGASGTGKTTLLERLRLQAPQEIAWCPQQGNLVPMLSVFHNIYMGRLHLNSSWKNLRNLAWPEARTLADVGELAEQLGIADKLRTSVDRLSGGQAQRTALARSLYTGASILLADEPVSSVDELQGQRLLQLAQSRHRASVIALHDRALALSCCTRIIGLRDGRVVLDAASADLDEAALGVLYP